MFLSFLLSANKAVAYSPSVLSSWATGKQGTTSNDTGDWALLVSLNSKTWDANVLTSISLYLLLSTIDQQLAYISRAEDKAIQHIFKDKQIIAPLMNL